MLIFRLFQEKLALLVPSSTKTKPEYQRAIAEIAAPIYLTRHQMERCWAKNFPTTLPMCVSLSSCFPQYHWKRNADGTLKIGHNQDQGYIIPFLKSLQQLLSVKSVYDSTLKSLERIKLNRNTSGVYSDVWDGSYIKTHELFIRLTRSSRVNETKIWGFQFRIESGKGCREKQIAHSYSEFQKKSNGVFSGFLSLIDPEIF